jgi:ParB family chromosome partitioning protein
MSKKKRFGVSEALTRGLSETINVVENNVGTFRNTVLPLSRVELDPHNPRKLAISIADLHQDLNKNDPDYQQKYDELEKLKELGNTIESSGVINPIVVYKRGEVYRVVAGERRCLASMLIGKQEIEARVFNENPKGFELKLIQWIENTAREDLTLNERIDNIRDILHEYQSQHGEISLSATLIRNIIGLSLSQATYYIAVLNAPDDIQALIQSGQLSNLDKAAILANITHHEFRHEAIQACLNGCSLKELRKIVAQQKLVKKTPEPKHISAKRGRAATRVNMGYTQQPSVIKKIIESVLSQASYEKYANFFQKVDWDHLDQTTRAFRKLVELLEHEMVR